MKFIKWCIAATSCNKCLEGEANDTIKDEKGTREGLQKGAEGLGAAEWVGLTIEGLFRVELRGRTKGGRGDEGERDWEKAGVGQRTILSADMIERAKGRGKGEPKAYGKRVKKAERE